ncbi:MAG: hypothetical protein ACOCQA_00090 [bacterium]
MAGNKIDYEKIEEAPEDVDFTRGDEVDILIDRFTDLGVRVIINNKYFGLVYEDDIYKSLSVGDKTKGYIKKIRDDRKIDVSLRKIGYGKVEDAKEKILNSLKENNGFLTLTDNSSPEEIKNKLKISKGSFKKAVGGLYKENIIDIKSRGIKLIK